MMHPLGLGYVHSHSPTGCCDVLGLSVWVGTIRIDLSHACRRAEDRQAHGHRALLIRSRPGGRAMRGRKEREAGRRDGGRKAMEGKRG